MTFDIRVLHRCLGGEIMHGEKGRYVLCPGPGHSAKDRSLSVKPADNDDGFIAYSHCGDDWRACLDHVRKKVGLPAFEPKGNGADDNVAAIYEYKDETGAVVFRKIRTVSGKPKFYIQHPDGRGGWAKGIGDDARRPLYRLPELLEALALERTVIVAEGEKDVDNLWNIGIPATCNFDGAGKWKSEYSQVLHGADMIVMPDHDEPGYGHADAIVRMSAGIAKRVRILKLAEYWPACPKGGDISDWIAAGGIREQLDVLLEKATDWKPGNGADQQNRGAGKAPSSWRDNVSKAQELCDRRFPALKFIIPMLFPEGVILLVSRPKLGKTWLLLQTATAIATGVITLMAGEDDPVQGDVLWLNLEDGDRRAQRRMTKYFGFNRDNWPERLTIARAWRRLDQGGIDDIRDWCRSVAKPTLVCIDTLKRVRAPKSRNQTDYDADYEASQGLLQLAHEFPGLTFIVAHHDRKMDAEDVFDTVSGTLGLTGGVDTIAILKRKGQSVTLHIEGRDLPDTVEKAIRLDRETCRWVILGEAAEVQRSAERTAVLDALRTRAGPMGVMDIMAATGMENRRAMDLLLFKMTAAQQIRRTGRGQYCHLDFVPPPPDTTPP